MLTWTRWRTSSNDQQTNVCERVRLFSALNIHVDAHETSASSRVTEQFSAFELLHQAATLACSNTKENWYENPNQHNDIDPLCSPSLPRRHARRSDRRPAPAHRRDAVAREGNRRRSNARRAPRDDAGTRALLGDRVRLAQVRGETERPPAVHDRDRWARHPLHSRSFAT